MKPDKNPFLLIPLGAIRLLVSDPDPMKEVSSLTQIYYLSICYDNDRDFITAIAVKDSKFLVEKRKKEQKALIRELFA